MSELDNYKVESGDVDPRGWTVVDGDAREIGVVDDLVVDTSAMKVRYFLVRSSDAATTTQPWLVDATTAKLVEHARQVRTDGAVSGDATTEYTRAAYSGTPADEERTRMTRSEEELRVGTRMVEAGEVVVGKHVETEHVSQPVTRRREEVVIERRPVSDERAAAGSISEDEIRVPLMEEEVVVETRPVVKEELVIGKRTVEERDVVETEVRREEFDIDESTTRSRANTTRDRRE